MKLYVFKHFIVCSVLALSKTTNSAIQTSIIKLSVHLVEMNKYFANIVWFINFGIDNLYYRPTI